MKNSELSQKIKSLRQEYGYSQAELSERSKISQRTIQRIENGKSSATGYTIKKIAETLNISHEELVEGNKHSNKLFLIIVTLSALSFILFPILGILIPLILISVKKERINSDDSFRKLLNFQITWFLTFVIAYACMLTTKIEHLGHYQFFFVALIILYFYNIVIILFNTIRIQNEKKVFYTAIQFIKPYL